MGAKFGAAITPSNDLFAAAVNDGTVEREVKRHGDGLDHCRVAPIRCSGRERPEIRRFRLEI